jgi:DNA-binding CsgD family transcriptional regulator
VHAEITANAETVRIQDMDSRNGTFLDNARVNEVELQPGQAVRFGSIRFLFVSDDGREMAGNDNSEKSTHFVHCKPAYEPPNVQELSIAQLRVLDLLLAGLAVRDVAASLHRSEHTVNNHIKEIYRKLGVTSRPELFSLFLADGKKPDFLTEK